MSCSNVTVVLSWCMISLFLIVRVVECEEAACTMVTLSDECMGFGAEDDRGKTGSWCEVESFEEGRDVDELV